MHLMMKPINQLYFNFNMKKLMFAAAGLLSMSVFAQKNEVKNAFKALEGNDLSTAKAQLSAADNLLAGKTYLLDPETQEQYFYTKGILAMKNGNTSEGAQAFAKLGQMSKTSFYTGKDSQKNKVFYLGKSEADASGISGLKTENYVPTLASKVNTAINPLLNQVNSEAVKAYEAKNYTGAGQKFEQVYNLMNAMGSAEGQYLYNAGLSYAQGSDYANAARVFKTLIDQGYTGVSTLYTAKEKSTGKTVQVDKGSWDMMKKTSDYTDFKTETTPSVEEQLYESYATLLVNGEKYGEATDFIKKAMTKYPKSAVLSNLQGVAYYKSGKSAEFASSLRQTLQNNPNDAQAWYNLGVILSEDPASKGEAEQAYRKAIVIQPDMKDAYTNLGNLLMGDDGKAVDAINAARKAGNAGEVSRLSEERRARFRNAIPVLESYYKMNPNDLDTVSLLKGLYLSTQNNAKFEDFKAKESLLKNKK